MGGPRISHAGQTILGFRRIAGYIVRNERPGVSPLRESGCMSTSWDGIVLGTGHNALVLQAYLCRSGLRVVSVDRAAVPGGGLATEANPRLPGFLHNTHSFFHRAVNVMPWYHDL